VRQHEGLIFCAKRGRKKGRSSSPFEPRKKLEPDRPVPEAGKQDTDPGQAIGGVEEGDVASVDASFGRDPGHDDEEGGDEDGEDEGDVPGLVLGVEKEYLRVEISEKTG
jgi:hypothetical protein